MRCILFLPIGFLCVSCNLLPTQSAPKNTVPLAEQGSQPTIEQLSNDLPPETPNSISLADVQAVERCDIGPAIQWMVNQKIIYTQNPSSEWRDCSGNFLRLSSHVAGICDVDLVAPPGVREYVKNGNNERPGIEEARTTRGIARWYDERGTFVPIFYDDVDITEAPKALTAVREKIKPGAVLWFSQRKPLASDKKDGLYRELGGAIGHMGTITSVERDANGLVTSWEMYHGQNKKKHNGITRHWWDWPDKFTSGGKEYPPGGYWSQRIVGFAESLVPDTSVEVVALRN